MAAGRTPGVLFLAAGAFTAVGIANLFATFFSWKLALIADVAAVVAVPVLWRRTRERSWALRAALACVAGSCVAVAALAFPVWRDHARHDARLARMAAALCASDLPEGARLATTCRGSITNTGNGNSCRYLVTAAVEAPSVYALMQGLHREGFIANAFDPFGDPKHDGRSYWRHGGHVHIALMSSWQEDGNDLRCT